MDTERHQSRVEDKAWCEHQEGEAPLATENAATCVLAEYR